MCFKREDRLWMSEAAQLAAHRCIGVDRVRRVAHRVSFVSVDDPFTCHGADRRTARSISAGWLYGAAIDGGDAAIVLVSSSHLERERIACVLGEHQLLDGVLEPHRTSRLLRQHRSYALV